jgi:hypothetical protein
VGITAWEPIADWLPLQAPLAAQEVAWVLDHVNVADWPAVIEVGLTEMLTVGAGEAADPLPPQACSVRPMRAAAAAGQGSRIRKQVRIGDMLSSFWCVTAQAPGCDPTRGHSHKYGIVRMDSGAEVVNSHTARLAPPEFYSMTRSNFRDGLRRVREII